MRDHGGNPSVQTASNASPKRRQVLEAAQELFMAHGYGAVSMEAVARRAGVSKATLYAHFESKDELFATMLGRSSLADTLADELFAPPAGDLRGLLEMLGRTVLRFLLRRQTLALIRIAVAETARFPELGRAFYERGPRRNREQMSRWVAAQQAAGRVRGDADPDIAAEQFTALLRSDLYMRATFNLPPPPTDAEIERTVMAAVDSWLRAYAA